MKHATVPLNVLHGDEVYLVASKQHNGKSNRLYGKIYEIKSKALKVKLNKHQIDTQLQYDLHFVANRWTFQLQHEALKNLKTFAITEFLFPAIDNNKEKNKISGYSIQLIYASLIFTNFCFSLKLFDKSIQENKKQLEAVENIVSGTSGSVPFLLMGLPGKLY